MIKVWDYKKEYELLRDDILNAVDGVFKKWNFNFGPNVDNLKKNFHPIMILSMGLVLVIAQMQ